MHIPMGDVRTEITMKKSNEFEVVGHYRSSNVFRVDSSKCAKDSNLTSKINMVGFSFIALLAVSALGAVSCLF